MLRVKIIKLPCHIEKVHDTYSIEIPCYNRKKSLKGTKNYPSCGATVSQTNTTFVQNSEHNHPSNPGADHAAIINSRCKVMGRDQVST